MAAGPSAGGAGGGLGPGRPGTARPGTALGLVAGATAAALALALAGPSPRQALEAVPASLAAGSTAADPAAPLVAVLAVLAWAFTAWLALVLLLALAARLPLAAGRAARWALRAVTPRAARRVLEVALGVALGAGAVTPAAAALPRAPLPPLPSAAVATPVPSAVQVPDLDWPGLLSAPSASPSTAGDAQVPAAAAPTGQPDATPSAVRPRATGSPTQAPTAPQTAPPAPSPSPEVAGPSRPVAAPAPAAPALAAPTSTAVTPAATVTVRPGDTLWALAAAHLESTGTAPTPSAVAQAWPAWWTANRQVVGPDPDLLRPGAVLVPPTTDQPTTD